MFSLQKPLKSLATSFQFSSTAEDLQVTFGTTSQTSLTLFSEIRTVTTLVNHPRM